MAKRNRQYTPLGRARATPKLRQPPFPGLIDGQKWTLRDAHWPTFILRSDGEEGSIMQVPFDDAPAARKLRLHEQAHAAWPLDVTEEEARDYGVQPRTIGCCDDARIIHKMAQRPEWKYLNETESILPEWLEEQHRINFQALAKKLSGGEEEGGDPGSSKAPTIPLVEAARLIASTRGYAEGAKYTSIASQTGLGWVVAAVQEMHRRFIVDRDGGTRKDVVAYAQELERFFAEKEDAIQEQNEDHEHTGLPHPGPELVHEEGRWGALQVEEVPLPERLVSNERRMKSADTGSAPRYMHRLPTDQRVFGRRRKKKVFEGTVLIDHSGSMSLTVNQVDEIMQRWPAVTIATYAGNNDYGVLRVVAKNGRRAALDHLGCPSAGANVVDGPALDWLAQQKGPRVWISDGGVTGIGEVHTPWLVADAAKKCRAGRIEHLLGVHDLIGDV